MAEQRLEAPSMERLRRRPLAAYLQRLRTSFLITSWIPLLILVVTRDLPPLPLAGYVAGVLVLTYAYHWFEGRRDRAGTALVPLSLQLDAEGLRVNVRNVGQATAQTCDVMVWLLRLPPDGEPSIEASATRLGSSRPHFSQRVFTMVAGEETGLQPLPRTPHFQRDITPGRYHMRWRTATSDMHGRRSSLEGWAEVQAG